MSRCATVLLLLFGLATVHVAAAQTTGLGAPAAFEQGRNGLGVGVALKGGTQGIGVEVSKKLSGRLGARANVNYFSYTRAAQQEVDSDNFSALFDIEGSVNMFSAGLLADFYPFKKVFRLSAGLVYNGNNIAVSMAASDSVRVTMNDADVYKSAEEVGPLGVDVSWAKLRPYVGFGLGRAAVGSRVNLLFDLGVIYAGGPNVAIETVDGSMLERNRENGAVITQNLDDNFLYRLYPVLSLGFSVRL